MSAALGGYCPFCRAGIGHREHVPSGLVRVGSDFGDEREPLGDE